MAHGRCTRRGSGSSSRSSDRAHVLSWTIQTEHCTSFFTPFDPVESCHPKQSYLRCTELSTLQKPVKVKLHCGAAVATRCQVLPDSPPGAFHWIPTSALQKEPDTSTKLCVVRNDNRAHGCPWVGRAPLLFNEAQHQTDRAAPEFRRHWRRVCRRGPGLGSLHGATTSELLQQVDDHVDSLHQSGALAGRRSQKLGVDVLVGFQDHIFFHVTCFLFS